MTKAWLELGAAFVAGGGFVALLRLIKFFVERHDRKSSIPDAMERIGEAYDHLAAIVRKTKAVRAIVVKLTNGGEIPRLGAQLYCSILYEYALEDHPSVRGKWQKRPIDRDHVQLLIDARRRFEVGGTGEQTVARAFADELEGQLHHAFKAYGVHCSETIGLRVTDGAFFYMAVHFDAEPVLNVTERDEIEVHINELKQMFLHPAVAPV